MAYTIAEKLRHPRGSVIDLHEVARELARLHSESDGKGVRKLFDAHTGFFFETKPAEKRERLEKMAHVTLYKASLLADEVERCGYEAINQLVNLSSLAAGPVAEFYRTVMDFQPPEQA